MPDPEEPGTTDPETPVEDPSTETDPVDTGGEGSGGESNGGDSEGGESTQESETTTATIIKPISGGGFGDCKVALVTFSGDKDDQSKGYLSPFKQAPIFVFADNGAVSYADGYVNVTAGGTVAFIFKG